MESSPLARPPHSKYDLLCRASVVGEPRSTQTCRSHRSRVHARADSETIDGVDIDAAKPLTPVYPFNEPGQPILLYEGPIGGFTSTDVHGSVELSCVPRLSLDWSVETDASPEFGSRSQATLLLRHPTGDMQLPVWLRGVDDGWSNGAELGNNDAQLKRIVAHWFNVPRLRGPITLTTTTPDGAQCWWSGRWAFQVGGWKITLDVRPDHQRVWRDLHKTHVYVMTHIMEICRADNADFTSSEAESVLSALHMGISFALGRFASPMLPVGLDAEGKIVWENWRAYHCDPARKATSGWWYDQDLDSLADLLGRVVGEFVHPDRLTQLRLQMMFAIVAINDQGFLEQRITTAAAGLEHIAWQALVLSGRMTEDQYLKRAPYQGRRLEARDRLRMLLTEAQIPIDIDPGLLPVTAQFVADEKQRQGRIMNGADVVTWTRNRLVHPKGAQENVYRLDGLTTELWCLSRHYLSLLILHSLGYRGSYRDLRKTDGWPSDTAKVPWA